MDTYITHDDLERYASDIASATNLLVEQVKYVGRSIPSSPSYLFDTPSNATRNDPSELHRARQNLLASLKQFQIYLTQPLDFIQQISSKVRCHCFAAPTMLPYQGKCRQLTVLSIQRAKFSRACGGWVTSRSLRASH